MNLLPFRFLRRIFRDHSLTFAVVFALALLGVSAWGTLFGLLRRIGIPWWAACILPLLLVSALAAREDRLVKDPVVRRRWSLGLAVGAIVVALLT